MHDGADPAAGPAQAAMVRSFALVYAEMAFERATAAERLAVVRCPSHMRT